MNKFTNEDCMEVMARYPDNHFDLAIVDPPYGIGASSKNFIRQGKQTGKSMAVSGTKYTAKDWDNWVPDKCYFDELRRVSQNQIVWGGNYFVENLTDSSCWVVWNKRNGENNNADCELAWTSFKTAVRMFEWKWNGMLQQNMKDKEERIHPTQKPKALYEWLLMNYAESGNKILDTHLGSGSIALACYDLKFDLVGIEIDSEYFQKASKRLEVHKKQLTLF